MKAETSSGSSELTQTTFLDPRPGTSFDFRSKDSSLISQDTVSSKIISPNGHISEGNLVASPQRLGLRDLTDEELGSAHDKLSPADERFHEDQNGDPYVHYERDTSNGKLTLDAKLSDVDGELRRREDARKLEKQNGKPLFHETDRSAVKVGKKQKGKKPNRFWAEYMKEKNKYLTPRIRSDR